MAEFNIKNLTQIEASNNLQIKFIGQALRSIKQGLEAMQQKLGVSASTTVEAPPNIASVTVSASNGVADVAITDNNSLFRAISYFVEYSTDPAFSTVSTHIIELGSGRNIRIPIFLGATLVYFRAYSKYADGSASNPVNFGGATPTGVATGGTGPALGTGQLAGTATATGQGSGDDVSRTRGGLEATL